MLFVLSVVALDHLLGLLQLDLSEFNHDLSRLDFLFDQLHNLRVHLVVSCVQLLLFNALSAQVLQGLLVVGQHELP